MPNTPNLSMPLLAAAQAQKHVTMNEGLTLLDAVVQLSALDRDLATPPGSPVAGARYLVAASPTGAWTGWATRIALYSDGAWLSIIPKAGWLCHVADEGVLLYFNGTAWVNLTAITNLAAQVVGANGSTTGIAVAEEELTLSGASVTAAAAARFPARSIILGASVRVTQAITGATSYNAGYSGSLSAFGGTLGLTLGSTNVGVIGPTAVYSLTPVILTAVGSNFTGGKVRVSIHYISAGAATS